MIGKMLTHFPTTCLLGEGWMGVVCDDEDTRFKRKVASRSFSNGSFFRLSHQHLRLDPLFDPLRDHPGLQKLLED